METVHQTQSRARQSFSPHTTPSQTCSTPASHKPCSQAHAAPKKPPPMCAWSKNTSFLQVPFFLRGGRRQTNQPSSLGVELASPVKQRAAWTSSQRIRCSQAPSIKVGSVYQERGTTITEGRGEWYSSCFRRSSFQPLSFSLSRESH